MGLSVLICTVGIKRVRLSLADARFHGCSGQECSILIPILVFPSQTGEAAATGGPEPRAQRQELRSWGQQAALWGQNLLWRAGKGVHLGVVIKFP